MDFTTQVHEQGARPLDFSQVGETGQEKIKKVNLPFVGTEGLLSLMRLYPAAARIERLGLVNPDQGSISSEFTRG